MPFVHKLLRVMLSLATVLAAAALRAAPDDEQVAAATREGRLVIYAATDLDFVRPLLADFERRYPGVKVEYHDMASSALFERFVDEARSGGHADVVWSSAMDLQIKLVNDGYAQPHRSAETLALPSWARWKDEAFSTTFEPVALVYNRKLLPADLIPDSHAALLRLLADPPEALRGRIATYDPTRSGLGFLLHSQDVLANPVVFWRLTEAFGRAGTRSFESTTEMLDGIAAGRLLLGYNLLGSYAQVRANLDDSLGVVLPRDYTLVMSRVAFIPRQAQHPNAARLWLDYLLSSHGQRLLSANPGFFPIGADQPDDEAGRQLRRELGGAFRPIPLGTGLLTYLDQLKRRDFLRQWRETIAPMP